MMKKTLPALLIILLLINLSVFADYYRLTGKVHDTKGKPLLGVLISLLPVTTQQTEKMVAVTDINGEYNFENLPKGKYKVAATTLDGNSSQEYQVSLGEGIIYKRDFTLNLAAVRSMKTKPVDTEWVLRSSKRDILRNDANASIPKVQKTNVNTHPDNLLGDNLQAAIKLERESSDLQKAPVNKTQVEFSGVFRDHSAFEVSALVSENPDFQPTFSAIGKYRNKILNNFGFEVGVDFKEYSNIEFYNNLTDDSNKAWRSSLYTKNSWQVWEPLQLNCSLKLDHYENVSSGSYLSPEVEIVYEPSEWAKIQGSVGLETVHADSAYSDFEELTTFIEGGDNPERATKYQLSFEGDLSGGYLITFQAYYSSVKNKRFTVLRNDSTNDQSNRFLFNAGDSVVQGLSLDFVKEVGSWLKGTVSYNLSKAVVLDTKRISLVFDNMSQIELLLGEEIAHELTTRLDAKIDATNTELTASYKVIVGSMGPEELSTGFVDTKRFDVQLIQKLPFLAFTGTDWEIHLNVRNLFDSHGLDYFLNSEDIVGARRKISGGVSIHF
ncbi:MAG: TonB-dependent receptor [Acidobacteria bacterium]|nr:TonB-dependent receptor [Acidobacteriota bacterium]